MTKRIKVQKAFQINDFHQDIARLLNLAVSWEHLARPLCTIKDGIFPKYNIPLKEPTGVGFTSKELRQLVLPIIWKIRARSDQICAHFNLKKIYFKTPVFYVSCMGDGTFINKHSDLLPISGPNYELNILLYFCSTPKGYSGGELELFWADGVELIEPSSNTLVVFPGHLEHAVRMVTCPSRDYASSRFVLVVRFCAPPTALQNFSRLVRFFSRRAQDVKNIFLRKQSYKNLV